MVDHITKTRSAAFYHLYSIRRIRRYLTKECTETLIHAVISSHLDYCNSRSFGSEFPNAIFINYRVQNAAARLVVQESRFCHITPPLNSLHWLPVKYHIVLKILLTKYKDIHGLAPAYTSELISVRDTTGRHNLRSNNGLRLNYSSCKPLATLGIVLFRCLSLNYGTIFHVH